MDELTERVSMGWTVGRAPSSHLFDFYSKIDLWINLLNFELVLISSFILIAFYNETDHLAPLQGIFMLFNVTCKPEMLNE
jgi:hypothetical protein